jgi:hypothetical protein
MSARPDFDDLRVELRLQLSNHIFPSQLAFDAVAPNVVNLFILADHAEIASFFQRAVALNVAAVVVDNVNIRSFHVISFLDD